MSEHSKSYRTLEREAVDYYLAHIEGLGETVCSAPNKAKLARALQERGREGRRELAGFELWLVEELGLAPSTARRKLRLVWGALCDYDGALWAKVIKGNRGEGCYGVSSWNYREDIRRAIRDFCEYLFDDDDLEQECKLGAELNLKYIGYDPEEIKNKARLRRAAARRRKTLRG